MERPGHDKSLRKSRLQPSVRVNPLQLGLRAILLDQVPRDLQTSAGTQQGLLEVALQTSRVICRRPNSRSSEPEHQGAIVTTAQAMLVGAALAWGPSLLVFAWIVQDIRNTR